MTHFAPPEYNFSMKGTVRKKGRNFYVDLHWRGERVRIFTDKDGYSLDSERRAERLLAHIQYEIDHGLFDPKNYVKRELKGLLWPNYLDAWVVRQEARREAGEISREYLRMIRSLCAHHVRGMFGNRSVRDITKGMLDDALVKLPKHLSTKTKYNVQGIVSKVLKDAFGREDIPKIPKVARIKVPDPRTSYIEEDAQAKVLEQITNPVTKAFFRFCMMHGCRPGEARALRWTDFDFGRGLVTIAAAMDQNEYRPCTKEGDVRVLPVNSECMAEIEALPRSLTGFVFTLRGKPLRKEYVSLTWRRAAKRAGVNINSYQGTRHSLISQLLNAGHSEALVREIAGHRCESSIKRYRHIKAESLRALIDGKVVEFKTVTKPSPGKK